MSVSIQKIEIFNFRSIRSLVLRPSSLAVLVGCNDSGKSNVLRALNLFFNGETDPGVPFDFAIDHNINNRPNRKAKECRIRLEIFIPPAYRDTNGDYIIWEKCWREFGELQERSGYYGVRDSVGPRGGRSLERVEIPPRSNLHALLRNVNYVYVPAIKDKSYISRLRGQIYNVIAEVAAERFLASSTEFEQSISDHLLSLTDEVDRTIGLQSRLALPKDLSHIFERLDFLNYDRTISLDQRGDGIKTRHVPIILNFMAEKMHTLHGRGAQPYSFIWGYEEPENNQEFGSGIKLAEQLIEYLDQSISQAMITTHSPIFYNLHRRGGSRHPTVSCHHVYCEDAEIGTKQTSDPSDIDEYMGTMTLVAPYVEEGVERVKQGQEAIQDANRDIDSAKPHVYVEGKSDRLVISRAIELFAPNDSEKIIVKSKDSGAGWQYVVDMLSAWRHFHKHHPGQPKAAGLVDADAPGKQAKADWNQSGRNVDSAKCFILPTPQHLVGAFKEGFKIPVVLEVLYKKEIWDSEDLKGNLESRDLSDVIPKKIMNDIVLNESKGIEAYLEGDWGVYITKNIASHRKFDLAKEIVDMSDEEARHQLGELEPVVQEMARYLAGSERESPPSHVL